MFTVSERLSVRERMKFTTRAFETLIDLNNRPHLLIAVEIRGAHFPLLDAEPFVRVAGERGEGPRSWITRIAEDGSAITGYFATDASLTGGTLEFGYGDAVFGRIGAFRPSVDRIDRDQLEAKPVVVTNDTVRRISKVKLDKDPLQFARD